MAAAVMPSAALPAVTTDELVRRAQAGDEVAFEALYRAHVARVYALCLRMAGNVEDAKALAQDAFVRAWEQLGTFRGEAAFATWLHRLAVNLVLMDRRQAARRREDPLPEGEQAAALARADAPLELRMDLEAAVAALPPMARQVLVLHDVEGYQHAEIGRLLGIAEGTSKAHLFRARRLLREALER